MKKFVVMMIFAFVAAFSANICSASCIYGGTVKNIQSYLAVREKLTVNSRDVMRVFNGDDQL